MTSENSLRLAIDIGGTFTDTVLMAGDGEIVASTKILTTHDNPATGAMAGARFALERVSRSFSDVTGFIHGTTLATNALIEKRGSRVATITTEGFRDILEIAYERRYAQYDIALEKPDFLVPRERSFTLRERMSVEGKVLVRLAHDAVDDLIADLDASEADAVAICFLHAYANDAHERELRDFLHAARPDLAISLSSEVSPEAREFDRLSTTVANSYIQPLMQGYLSSLRSEFEAEGLACPILMMTASGGMCTLETASRFPIRLVESGPAGGAVLAAKVAKETGEKAVLSFDMGGTTAKLCLIDAFEPQMARQFEIARAARFIKGSGMPVRIPVVEMIEIGAGGGSIASVDRLGRLQVGPKSAGSDPGPVAFGRGGQDPTVTDSDITLGYILPDVFAEGRLTLDLKSADDALQTRIGDPLDVDSLEAARGVSAIVDENMASAARIHAVESGKDLGARTMIAFGGNGPLHAGRVARAAGVQTIIIPPDPSVGSAIGFLHAPVSFEIVRSKYTLLQEIDLEGLNHLFSRMINEARAVVEQGAPNGAFDIRRSAFMRYHGQGHEIEILLDDRPLERVDIAVLQAGFEAAYQTQFSRPVPGMTIEILNWAVRVVEQIKPVQPLSLQADLQVRDPERQHEIVCDLTGVRRQASVFARADLNPGDAIEGPALIIEAQTTSFVPVDFSAQMETDGYLILRRNQNGDQS